MTIHSLVVTSVALLIAASPAVALTTVQLKSGASLEAEVIAEKADRIVVDLGFTVVTVPRDEIESLKTKETTGIVGLEVDPQARVTLRAKLGRVMAALDEAGVPAAAQYRRGLAALCGER